MQVKPYRHSANPRLTLGIDEDNTSILDAFTEEAANIGADVSASARAIQADGGLARIQDPREAESPCDLRRQGRA